MNNNSLHTEQELFRLISVGNEDAFNTLYETVIVDFTPYLYHRTQSHEAVKEILQEALIRFWLNRHKLPEIKHPKAWLFRIVANECYRYLRKHILQEQFTDKLAEYQTSRGVDGWHQTEMDLSFRETQRIIRQAVTELSPRQKSIYQLSREAALKPEEIAAQLGVSANYVKKTLIVALRAIQQRLIQEGRILPLALILWV